jgi:hypothetical protein
MIERIIITIDTVNDAFEDDQGCEAARILRALADDIEGGFCITSRLYDYNGNAVGNVKYEADL